MFFPNLRAQLTSRLQFLLKKMRNRIDVLRPDLLNASALNDENVRNGKLGNDFMIWNDRINIDYGLRPFAMLSTDLETLFKGKLEH